MQLIDTNKIFKYLDYLRKAGHPSYKFYDDWSVYQRRCLEEDPGGAKLVFPEPKEEMIDLKKYLSQLRETDVEIAGDGKNDMEFSEHEIEQEHKHVYVH